MTGHILTLHKTQAQLSLRHSHNPQPLICMEPERLSHRSRSAVGTAWNWTMASVRCTRGPRARQKALTGSSSGSMLGSFVRWLSSSARAGHNACDKSLLHA